MKNIWKRHIIKRYLALLLSTVLLFTGGASVRAIDMIYSNQNEHYLIYNNLNALFDKMTQAYEENNLAILGVNVFLPLNEEATIEQGEELLYEIQTKLNGKYLIETIHVSDGLTVYFTADVMTFEIYLLVSNATDEEHVFTILFTDGMEFDEIATAYSFEEKELKLFPSIPTVSGGAIVIEGEDVTTPAPEEGEDEATPTPVEDENEATPTPVEGEDVTTPTPVEGEDVTTPTPEEGEDEATPTPVEGEDVTTPTPVEGENVTTPTPEEGEDEATPTPVEGEDEATPTPVEGGNATTPTPVEGENVTTTTPGEDEENPTILDTNSLILNSFNIFSSRLSTVNQLSESSPVVEDEDNEDIDNPVIEDEDNEDIDNPVIEDENNEDIENPVIEDENNEDIENPLVEDENNEDIENPVIEDENNEDIENPVIEDENNEDIENPIIEDENNEDIENPVVEDENNDDIENPVVEDENEDIIEEEQPLLIANISALLAMNTLNNSSLSFKVASSSANALNGTITDVLEVTPTIDKTGTKNEDGSYTINLSVTGNQDESVEIIKQSYPINLVFAIDISTSMNNSVGGGSTSNSNPSRWKLLVDQMNSMVDYVLSSSTGNVESKISIIAYASNNRNFIQGKYYMLLANRSSNAEAIKNTYSTLNSNGTRTPKTVESLKGDTNYGTNNHAGFLGVREHLSEVTTNANSTYVIYLTDGEANRYLIPTSNGNYTQSNSVNADTAISYALTEARAIKPAFPNKTIKIFTIGIGNDSNKIADLLNPSNNKYQDKYYSINNVEGFNQIFTDLSKEITETNTLYVTNMKISDTLSQYVELQPDSFVVTYNGNVVYDNTNPNNVVNLNQWPDEYLPQYNSSDRTITWRIMDSEGKLGTNQTYRLSYKVSVNNEQLPLAPASDQYYAYYHDWDLNGIKEVRYYNAEQATSHGLTDSDRVDDEVYYPSNDIAELEYNDGKTLSILTFPHPAVKADIKGTLIIKKELTNTSDQTDKEFVFEVKIGENGETPVLYNGVATISNGNSLVNYNIINGILKLRANETASIKLTTLKAAYSVTELTYVDNSGYSESTLEKVHREVVKSLNNELVSSNEVTPTILPTGANVTGNLYSITSAVEDDIEAYWESRDIDNGSTGVWRTILVGTSEEARIRALSRNSEGFFYETGKLLPNGSLEKLPAPVENENGHYEGTKVPANWIPWSNYVELSYRNNNTRVSGGTREYRYFNNGGNQWRTAEEIFKFNQYKNYDGYVEFSTVINKNTWYFIRFYKEDNSYNDERQYRFVPGSEGGETTVTTPLDVTLTFTNKYTDIDGSIEVGKVIDEFLPQHGNAVFYFRLDKLDENNEVINSYFDYLEFESLTNDNRVLFNHLPKGNYRLTEVQPIRYEFESVLSAEGANAYMDDASAENNGEILFEITSEEQEGTAVYSNTKVYNKYFSHTDVKRNTITIKKNSANINS